MRNDKRMNIVALISVSEAWLSMVDKKDMKDFTMTSKDPKKIEMLIFNAMDKEGNNLFHCHEIKEVNAKRFVSPKPYKEKMDKIENRLLGSFWKGHEGYVKTGFSEM